VAGNSRWVIPFRKVDLPQLVLEIVVVVENDAGIDAAEARFLEQMRPPQIADVGVDAAAFAPDIARQHREQAEAAKQPEEFDPTHVQLPPGERFRFQGCACRVQPSSNCFSAK
jgi:hypothetical protein